MTIYLINRSIGGYDECNECALFYVMSEDAAKNVVETLNRQKVEYGDLKPDTKPYWIRVDGRPTKAPEPIDEITAHNSRAEAKFKEDLRLAGVIDIEIFPFSRSDTPFYDYVAVDEFKL